MSDHEMPSIGNVKFKIMEGLDYYGNGGFVDSHETWNDLRAEAAAVPSEGEGYNLGLTALAANVRERLLLPFSDENGGASAANESMIAASRMLGVGPNPTTTASMDLTALTKYSHYTMVNQGKEQSAGLKLAELADERHEGFIGRRAQFAQIGFVALRGARFARLKASWHKLGDATANKLLREL